MPEVNSNPSTRNSNCDAALVQDGRTERVLENRAPAGFSGSPQAFFIALAGHGLAAHGDWSRSGLRDRLPHTRRPEGLLSPWALWNCSGIRPARVVLSHLLDCVRSPAHLICCSPALARRARLLPLSGRQDHASQARGTAANDSAQPRSAAGVPWVLASSSAQPRARRGICVDALAAPRRLNSPRSGGGA
jgi:hypothetical protein